MELLDDTFNLSPELSREGIIQIFNLRDSYKKELKAISNARKTVIFISVMTFFQLMKNYSPTEIDTISIISIVLIVLFGAIATTALKYVKYTFTLALGLYVLSLLITFIFNPFFAILSLLLKGIIIYFLTVGVIAAFKMPNILSQMERFDMMPEKT